MGCYFSELFLTEETDLLVKTTRLFSHILLVDDNQLLETHFLSPFQTPGYTNV